MTDLGQWSTSPPHALLPNTDRHTTNAKNKNTLASAWDILRNKAKLQISTLSHIHGGELHTGYTSDCFYYFVTVSNSKYLQ